MLNVKVKLFGGVFFALLREKMFEIPTVSHPQCGSYSHISYVLVDN